MFHIISDSSCDFSNEEAVHHDITVVPLYVSFDHVNYLREGIDISKEEYFKRLMSEKGVFPKTSQPSPQDYADVFMPPLRDGKDIICMTISSQLSGSYASAVLAADMVKEEFPERTIIVIDSMNVSLGHGLILRELINMRNAGLLTQEAAQMIETVRASARVYFTLETLEYLKRGGRVGPTTALVGNILGLRPVLQIEDGQVKPLDNVRGKKRVFQLIEDALVYTLKDETQNINLVVAHIQNADDAMMLKQNIEHALGVTYTQSVTEIGVTVGAHAGPGALGLAYCKTYEAIVRENA